MYEMGEKQFGVGMIIIISFPLLLYHATSKMKEEREKKKCKKIIHVSKWCSSIW